MLNQRNASFIACDVNTAAFIHPTAVQMEKAPGEAYLEHRNMRLAA
jgi:hypothetical protein